MKTIVLPRNMIQLIIQGKKELHRILYDENALQILEDGKIHFTDKHDIDITLDIKAHRIERLRDISNEDAILEGVEKVGKLYKDYIDSAKFQSDYGCLNPKLSYRSLWQQLNGQNAWDENPIVCVIIF